MQEKISWITNLRGIACLMVVMIHSTTWYITHPHSISLFEWDIANLLNSASRVSVPLFFMISGYLFFWRTQRPAASLSAHRAVYPVLQRAGAALYHPVYPYQRWAVIKKLTAEAGVLSPVVFLCHCGDLSALAADSGEAGQRQNAAGADAGDWPHRQP